MKKLPSWLNARFRILYNIGSDKGYNIEIMRLITKLVDKFYKTGVHTQFVIVSVCDCVCVCKRKI